MDRYGPGVWLEACLAKPPEIQLQNPNTWKVGYCIAQVFWEEFASFEEAEPRYKDLWWSKVLLHPDGHVLRCSSSMADRKGVGVAKLIISSRIQQPRDVVDPVSAIDQGEAPFITADLWLVLQKTWRRVWERVAFRNLIKWCSSASRLFYFDVEEYPGVRGHVALTIDDAPCRLGPKNSKVPEVRTLLRKYNAQASFMLIGSFVPGNEDDLVSLLKDGHEFGNHGFVDKNYASCSHEEVEAAIDRCSKHITDLQHRAGLPQHVRWFRPPHGKLSATMSEVLEQKKLTSVMCDAYAWCAQIQDGEFIGNFLGTQAQHGSIIILHMPEHGFREWCFVGLEALLRLLDDRGLQAVSLGTLAARAGWTDR